MNFPSFRYAFRIIVSGVPFLFLLSPLFFTRADHALSVSVPPNQANVLRFGGGQIALAPLRSPLNLGNQFTLETWVYLESASPLGVIMGKTHDPRGSDPFISYVLDFNNDRLEFVQTTGQPGSYRSAAAPGVFPLRVWTHVAATLDSGTMRLYINGQEVARQTSPGTPENGAAPFALGSGATPDGKITCCALNGALRQARVWSRALNAAELTDNAARILNGNEAGLIAYWPLDDGAGQAVKDRGPNNLPLQLGTSPNDGIYDPLWIKPSVLEGGPYFSLEEVQGPWSRVGRLIDFDHDGDLDFVTNDYIFPSTPGSTFAFRNDGSGRFVDATTAVLGNQDIQTTVPRDHAVTDFNGDGRMDLFIADHGSDAPPFPGGQSRILIQTSDGKLIDETNSRIPLQNAFTHSVTTGDIDGDGDMDIYMCNIFNPSRIGPRFLLNDGKGYFREDLTRIPSSITQLQIFFTASKLVDVDQDGDLDLVLGRIPNGPVAGAIARDVILLNDGTGRFNFASDSAMPLRSGGINWGTVHIETADFDGDGWPDLLMSIVREDYQEPKLQLLLNNGDGTFREASDRVPQQWLIPSWVIYSFAADFNNDGWIDFVTTGVQVRPHLYLNTGQAQFVDASELLPSAVFLARFIQPGDLDKDGKADLFMVNGWANGHYHVLRNLKPHAVAQAKPQASVSAANYSGLRLASESIVAAFGAGLATATQAASATPLPTSLAGTMIKVKDNLGVERLAPLFFVSPNQVNYQLPPGTSPGAATITISNADGTNFIGTRRIAPVAPGLFAANANGQGVAAAVALRVKTDGSQSFEAVARYDASQNQFVSVPLELGPSGDQVYLILFGTGWRGRSGLTAVTCKLGGLDAGVSFAGAQGDLVGLDQVNIGALPRNLAGRGEVDLVLTVEGKAANAVHVNLK